MNKKQYKPHEYTTNKGETYREAGSLWENNWDDGTTSFSGEVCGVKVRISANKFWEQGSKKPQWRVYELISGGRTQEVINNLDEIRASVAPFNPMQEEDVPF